MNFELITKHFRPKSCLDVGAHIGMWHNHARLHWLDAYFFLIEGNPACAEQLAMTGASMRIALLSDEEKEVTFYTRKDAPSCTGSSYRRENTDFYAEGKVDETKMMTRKLSDVVEGQVFDLIKIDTQGSELDIMRGGLDIIKAAKGVILEMSLVEYNKGAPTWDEVTAFMKDIGFEAAENLGWIVHPISRENIQADILFLKA